MKTFYSLAQQQKLIGEEIWYLMVLGTYFMLKSFSCNQNKLGIPILRYKLKQKWGNWNDSNMYYNTTAIYFHVQSNKRHLVRMRVDK